MDQPNNDPPNDPGNDSRNRPNDPPNDPGHDSRDDSKNEPVNLKERYHKLLSTGKLRITLIYPIIFGKCFLFFFLSADNEYQYPAGYNPNYNYDQADLYKKIFHAKENEYIYEDDDNNGKKYEHGLDYYLTITPRMKKLLQVMCAKGKIMDKRKRNRKAGKDDPDYGPDYDVFKKIALETIIEKCNISAKSIKEVKLFSHFVLEDSGYYGNLFKNIILDGMAVVKAFRANHDPNDVYCMFTGATETTIIDECGLDGSDINGVEKMRLWSALFAQKNKLSNVEPKDFDSEYDLFKKTISEVIKTNTYASDCDPDYDPEYSWLSRVFPNMMDAPKYDSSYDVFKNAISEVTKTGKDDPEHAWLAKTLAKLSFFYDAVLEAFQEDGIKGVDRCVAKKLSVIFFELFLIFFFF